MMGWPPKINCKEVDTLVEDFCNVIRNRHEETESHFGSPTAYPIYTNDKIICALEMVKTRIIASEILVVKSNSER